MKQVIKLASAMLLVSTMWVSPASAVADWFECKVTLAGFSSNGSVRLELTDLADVPAFGHTDFFLEQARKQPANANAFLAIGLSAIMSNLSVWVFADPDLDTPTIFQINLLNEAS